MLSGVGVGKLPGTLLSKMPSAGFVKSKVGVGVGKISVVVGVGSGVGSSVAVGVGVGTMGDGVGVEIKGLTNPTVKLYSLSVTPGAGLS